MQSDGHDDNEAGLSREVRELIRDHIHSLEQLDLLLLLHRRAGQTLTPAEVAHALGSTDALARATMAHLRRRGLSTIGEPFAARYAPGSEALHRRVSLLAASYTEARAQVLTFISACALERVREAQGRAFAHAYLADRPKKE